MSYLWGSYLVNSFQVAKQPCCAGPLRDSFFLHRLHWALTVPYFAKWSHANDASEGRLMLDCMKWINYFNSTWHKIKRNLCWQTDQHQLLPSSDWLLLLSPLRLHRHWSLETNKELWLSLIALSHCTCLMGLGEGQKWCLDDPRNSFCLVETRDVTNTARDSRREISRDKHQSRQQLTCLLALLPR